MGIFAWLATAFSILYLIWAIRNDSLCFVFGFISAAFWAVESYFNLHLVFDAGLQVFYMLMSILGIYRWQYGGEDRSEKAISLLSVKEHAFVFLICGLASLLLVYLSQFFEVISFQVLDAVTTTFMIAGTILLIERKLSSWLYLVVCDVLYVYIYGSLGAWLFMAMMLLYIVFGAVGYREWKKLFAVQNQS